MEGRPLAECVVVDIDVSPACSKQAPAASERYHIYISKNTQPLTDWRTDGQTINNVRRRTSRRRSSITPRFRYHHHHRHHHHHHIRLFKAVKRNHTHSSSPVNTRVPSYSKTFSSVQSVVCCTQYVELVRIFVQHTDKKSLSLTRLVLLIRVIADALIGQIMNLVRLSVCPVRARNSTTKRRNKTEIGAKLPRGRRNRGVPIFT